jgi:hypothetical protein
MFILLPTLRNVLSLDNTEQKTHSYISTATTGFLLRTAELHQQCTGNGMLRFHCNNGEANAPFLRYMYTAYSASLSTRNNSEYWKQ